MSTIMHRVEIDCEQSSLYDAFASSEGISKWWSSAELRNDELTVFFGTNEVRFDVVESIPNERVIWKCTAGPWIDTERFVASFETAENGRSVVEFAHSGWQRADQFFMHCNSKWGFFLTVSLKNYLERGAGTPHPNEPSI